MVKRKQSHTANANSMNDKLNYKAKRSPELIKSQQEIIKKNNILRVSEKEWTKTHPVMMKCGSDRYYANLANTLQNAFIKLNLPLIIPDNLIYEISMTLSAYLEDLVSGVGVWNSVKSLYRKQYGAWLPFFDCNHADYFEDDLNIEDIKFLVWQAWCRCGQQIEYTYSPLSEAVNIMAAIAYNILIDKFDEAPQCTRVVDQINKIFEDGDYYEVRKLGVWLGVDNKLTAAPDLRNYIMVSTVEVMQTQSQKIDINEAYYLTEVSHAWKNAISMLGCPTNVLLAELAERDGYGEVARLLKELVVRRYSSYSVTSVKPRFVIKDILGKEYLIDPTSLMSTDGLEDVKSFFGSIVKYGELWQQNGLGIFSRNQPNDADGHLHITNVPDYIKEHLKRFVKDNNGRRVYYCKDLTEASDLISVLKATPMSLDEDNEDVDNFAVMVSDDYSPQIFPDICGIFSDKDNVYFNPDEDPEWMAMESLRLIMTGNIPDDVAKYIQDKKIMPAACLNASQGEEVGKSIVQNNLRFLFGFYRVESYKPEDYSCI